MLEIVLLEYPTSLLPDEASVPNSIPLVDGFASRLASTFQLQNIAHATFPCQDLCYDILTQGGLLLVCHVLVPPRQANLALSIKDNDEINLIDAGVRVVDVIRLTKNSSPRVEPVHRCFRSGFMFSSFSTTNAY